MKVFISGSKRNIEVTGLIKERLDTFISQGADILIGDCNGVDRCVQAYLASVRYARVTVYVSGKRTRNNVGRWDEKHFPASKKNGGYRFYVVKDIEMAKDADCGLIIWDGESKGSFVNMLNLLALDRACEMFHIKVGIWTDIRTMDDIKPYVGELGELTGADFEMVFRECDFSEEMRDLLRGRDFLPREISTVIAGAPISLEKKRTILHTLLQKRDLLADLYAAVSENKRKGADFKVIERDLLSVLDEPKDPWLPIWRAYWDITEAGGKLYDEMCCTVLYLFVEWYDTDVFMEKSFPEGAFCSPGQVSEYISREPYDDPGEIYYRLELWERIYEETEDLCEDRGRYVHLYDYYIYNGEICWFEKMKEKETEEGNIWYAPESHDYTQGSLDLNMFTPFKTGDIVHIDCRPFGPPFHAMILEARDQFDCCFPTILFRVLYTDEWRVTALKHRMFYEGAEMLYTPMLSPLYRIRTVQQQELQKGDALLLEVRDRLQGDERRAEDFWEKWNEKGTDDGSEQQVLEILKTI